MNSVVVGSCDTSSICWKSRPTARRAITETRFSSAIVLVRSPTRAQSESRSKRISRSTVGKLAGRSPERLADSTSMWLVSAAAFIAGQRPCSQRAVQCASRFSRHAPPIPPPQHPQRAQSIPAARRAEAFELEISLPFVRVFERPAPVLALAATDDVDCLG